MLWTIVAILLVLWMLGWGMQVAGRLIHLLLVVALVMLAGAICCRPADVRSCASSAALQSATASARQCLIRARSVLARHPE